MFRKLLFIIFFLGALTASSAYAYSVSTDWSYGTGSNIDSSITIRTNFYKEKQIVFSSRIGGGAGGLLSERIKNREYYWAGGGGISTDGIQIPDHAEIEIVSFYDQKRYRIKVDLPNNLEQQMKRVYKIKGREERRDQLYFGMAPGGYYEVLLMGRSLGVSPDILLSRGIAEEVTDDWYDQKVPVAEQYGMDSFVSKYGELFNKHPVPSGMAWAPIMDAYRAAQPVTDVNPVSE